MDSYKTMILNSAKRFRGSLCEAKMFEKAELIVINEHFSNIFNEAEATQIVLLNKLCGCKTRRPRPLKIKPAKVTSNIHHLADEKQTGLRFSFHGF